MGIYCPELNTPIMEAFWEALQENGKRRSWEYEGFSEYMFCCGGKEGGKDARAGERHLFFRKNEKKRGNAITE